MDRRAVDAVTRPRRGRHVEQVDAVVFGERQSFALEPIEIGIDAVTRVLRGFGDFADVHVFLRTLWRILSFPAQRGRGTARNARQPNSSDLITTGTTPGGAISSP